MCRLRRRLRELQFPSDGLSAADVAAYFTVDDASSDKAAPPALEAEHNDSDGGSAGGGYRRVPSPPPIRLGAEGLAAAAAGAPTVAEAACDAKGPRRQLPLAGLSFDGTAGDCFDDAVAFAVADTCPRLAALFAPAGAAVTDAGLARLAARCPLLSTLCVAGAPITGAGLLAVAGSCRRLTGLDVGGCPLLTSPAELGAALRRAPRLDTVLAPSACVAGGVQTAHPDVFLHGKD